MNVVVFCGSHSHRPQDLQLGRELGQALASDQHHVITGGGPGVMDAVMQGAKSCGGMTTGVQLTVRGRVQSRYSDRVIRFRKLHRRQRKLLQMGDAFVACCGGLGTGFEVLDVLAHVRKGQLPLVPLVLLGEAMADLHDWLIKASELDPSSRSLWTYAEGVEDSVTLIQCGLNKRITIQS